MFNPAAPEALLCWRTGERAFHPWVNGLPVMERSVRAFSQQSARFCTATVDRSSGADGYHFSIASSKKGEVSLLDLPEVYPCARPV
jgi:hypothetical protein